MGSAAGAQGGPMRPQPPQQKPMGPQQGPQGKGPGLPMPQQPNMGGQKPYQPVGANNGPFHQNPVAPVQQPMQPMPPQGKGGVAQPARPILPGQIDPGFGVNTQPNQGKAPGQPMGDMPNNLPSGLSGLIQQPGNNMITGSGGMNGVMQQPNQGKGPQSPFNIPAKTGPVQPMGDMPAYRPHQARQNSQGKGPGVANPMNQPGMGPMGPSGPGTFA